MMLLMVALVIIACILCNRFTNRFGIPTLLAFIILGMIFGSDGLFRIPFDNYAFAENICSAALILIMFYGGFGTNWNQARPAAVPAVVLSISLQGSLLPAVAKKLDMIDDEENVMRTFNDYADETAINFVRITVTSRHAWAWMPISHLALSSDLLIVMIRRGSETVIPNGNTKILEGDILVINRDDTQRAI